MICTGYNSHILSLLEKQEILWKCILNDGTQVWSDFDVPEQKDPWTRLKNYCNNNNNKYITEVKVLCPGMPETSIYKDENGLDNFLITRGMIRDLTDDADMVFRFMCFGKLNNQGTIDVTKFYWPEFELKEASEVRQMTPENDSLMYKRRKICGDDCTCPSNEQN
jgi:hypothetical protein